MNRDMVFPTRIYRTENNFKPTSKSQSTIPTSRQCYYMELKSGELL